MPKNQLPELSYDESQFLSTQVSALTEEELFHEINLTYRISAGVEYIRALTARQREYQTSNFTGSHDERPPEVRVRINTAAVVDLRFTRDLEITDDIEKDIRRRINLIDEVSGDSDSS